MLTIKKFAVCVLAGLSMMALGESTLSAAGRGAYHRMQASDNFWYRSTQSSQQGKPRPISPIQSPISTPQCLPPASSAPMISAPNVKPLDSVPSQQIILESGPRSGVVPGAK